MILCYYELLSTLVAAKYTHLTLKTAEFESLLYNAAQKERDAATSSTEIRVSGQLKFDKNLSLIASEKGIAI